MSFILNSISSKRQLKWWVIIFFLLLTLPSSFLIYKSLVQLKWQQIYQYRQLAEEFTARVDVELQKRILQFELLSLSDFNFMKLAGNEKINYLQRSILSDFPVKQHEQGILGYFQVDNEGLFSTPLLPEDATDNLLDLERFAIPQQELLQRKQLEDQLFEILLKNQLIKTDMKKYAINVDKINNERLDYPGESIAGLGKSVKKKTTDKIDATLIASEAVMPGIVSLRLQNKKIKSIPSSQAAFDSLVDSPKDEGISSDEERQSNQSIPGDFNKLTSLVEERKKINNETAPLSQKISEKDKLKADDILLLVYKKEQRNMKKRKYNLQRREVDKLSKKKVAVRTLTYNNIKATPRKEKTVFAEKFENQDEESKNGRKRNYKIKIFEAEIEPFALARLETGEFVLFRKVWRAGVRLIQGMIINPEIYIKSLIGTDFTNTSLSQMGRLDVFYADNKLMSFISPKYQRMIDEYYAIANENRNTFKTTLSPPFSKVLLSFSIDRVPLNAGARIIYVASLTFVIILIVGLLIFYRLILKQLALVQQQRDFVSSVSHELKTPLTSIRMYGEMLLQNWVSEDKKNTYYQYIYDESERLSRLISNVLQFSSITRDSLKLSMESITVFELVALVKSKTLNQVEGSGFKLNISLQAEVKNYLLKIDLDAFVQIMINLFDNAIKFTQHAKLKQIDLVCRLENDDSIVFIVRDYGQGIDHDQMKKIFKLFYRAENELTRETVGTGIGLALVHSLVCAMGADIDVVNVDPGVEFRLYCQAEKRE